MLNEDLPGTTFIYVSVYKAELSAKMNVLSNMDDGFFNFIANAPFIEIAPSNVKDIRSNEFEAIKEQLMNTIAELKDNFNLREQAFLRQTQELTLALEAQIQQQELTRQQNERTMNQFQEQIREMKDRQTEEIKRLQGEHKRQIDREREANNRVQQIPVRKRGRCIIL